jgi:Domain of unknown function (DUF1707)
VTDTEPPLPHRTSEDTVGLRAADADREAVADRLQAAAREGRIDFAELEERLARAYGARTYGELEAVVTDLPGQSPSATHPGIDAEPETLVLKTTTANIRQTGRWVVPRRIAAESTTGLITIDFTQATCAHSEVSVEATTRTGWIRLIVPDGWAARVGPASTNVGHISNKAAETAEPGAPTVTVTGHPVSGYIKIKQRRRKR